MPSYLFSFQAPTDYTPGEVSMAEWGRFFEGISSQLEDLGNPIFSRQTVGETGAGTVLSGYSLVNAESIQQAVELARGCPLVKLGGGVEVGELTRLSEDRLTTQLSDHPALA
ncbi:MAG TPA: hypothetical protein VE570_16270 [Thermoleophilaceae bacterium]|jgi:hypothetical protein|nr:hypothetical protein [Thermoleophilaceae bacterium]